MSNLLHTEFFRQGKTTLLNRLLGKSLFTRNTTSGKKSKGRHTTTHRQLITLESGAMPVDTPGMRELGNFTIDADLAETFSDIRRLIDSCYFSDWPHTNERNLQYGMPLKVRGYLR